MNSRAVIEPTFWLKVVEWVLGIVQCALTFAYPVLPDNCSNYYYYYDIWDIFYVSYGCLIEMSLLRMGAIMFPLIILPALFAAHFLHRGFARNIVNLLFSFSGVLVYVGAATAAINGPITPEAPNGILITISVLSCITATICLADFITDIVLKCKRGRH